MYKLTVLFSVFLLVGCTKDKIEECPCFADSQNPIYKGCDPGTIYDLEKDCSPEMALIQQIFSALKYPPEARADSVQGTVLVRFDIFENGSIGNFSTPYDTLGHGLPEAAIAAVMTLGEKGYCPARDSCVPIVFTFTLPIKFVLH